MTTQFRLTPSMIRRADVIEVWMDGRMVGTLYPTDGGVRFISKYEFETTEMQDVVEIIIKPLE